MEFTKWNKVCKMEQYLNYILMIKNQNILATLMIFLSQLKTFMKSFKQKRRTSRTAIGEFFSKISNKRKISNKQFHHCEANIFLKKVTKSINSQTNIKFSGNDSLTAKFYKHLSNELHPNIQCLSIISCLIMFRFINPDKTLARWVLALE